MTLATTDELFKNIAKGKGQHIIGLSATAGTASGGAAASGFFTNRLNANILGTTIPGTLASHSGVAFPSDELLQLLHFSTTPTLYTASYLVWLYKIGTLSLTSTGDQFTHDAATFPLLRTQYGASQAIDLLPLVYITTATTTTAPVFRLRTVAGGAGYVNQGGSGVIGAKTMTLPAAATAAQSGFMFRLENGDGAVQDITNVEVTTASSAGAATIYGVEIIAPMFSALSNIASLYNGVYGGMGIGMKPASATSGSVNATLAVLMGGTAGSSTSSFYNCSTSTA